MWQVARVRLTPHPTLQVDDLHLIRDETTGKSKGFGFLKYDDARSTVLAVDNMNGAVVLGRTLRVDHKMGYEAPKAKKGTEAAEEAAAAAAAGKVRRRRRGRGGVQRRQRRASIEGGGVL